MLSWRLFGAGRSALRRFLWTTESRGDDLVLREDSREELRYPHLWLRDNCQCPQCFHKPSHSRIIDIEGFDFEAHPLSSAVKNDNLEVKWSDNHESSYSLKWLLDRQFTGPNQEEWLATQYRPWQRPWVKTNCPALLTRLRYQELLDNDDALLRWLEMLAVDGVALIEGVGTSPDMLQALADRVSFLKQTYYGETFTVRAKPGTSNVAYLSGALQLHTDLPYYHYKPGVNMLHCIQQSEGGGGESQLSDGLAACHYLRDNHPSHYWILSTVPVEWEDVVRENGKDYHAVFRAPVICEEDGRVVRVNFSQPQRGSHFNVPVDQVTPWYRALQLFVSRIHSPEHKVFYKMRPGEILTFDNMRVLHGRSTYEGDRHLEGGYLDWDFVYSKIRVLRRRKLS